MRASARQRLRRGDTGGLNRRGAITGRRVTELPDPVAADAPDRPVGFAHERMLAARGDGGHAAKRRDDRRGRVGASRGGTAQLAEVVVAPRPHRAVGLQHQRMLVSRTDGHDIRQREVDGRVLTLPRRRTVTELPVVIGAPRPHRTIAGERQRVVRVRRDRHNVGEPGHRRRHKPIGVGPVTELPVLIATPGPGVSIWCDGDRMLRTSRDSGRMGRRGQAHHERQKHT